MFPPTLCEVRESFNILLTSSRHNKKINSKKMINVICQESFFQDHSLYKTQLLISQILHDMISPFSALSTGLDLVEGKTDDIWPLICQSRDHLYAQMVMLRFIFSYGEGSYEESLQACTLYSKSLGITLQGTPPKDSVAYKLSVALGFWVMKHHRSGSGLALLEWGEPNSLIQFHSSCIKDVPKDDSILELGGAISSPQETFAAYIHILLENYHKKITLVRKQGFIKLSIQEKE